MTPKECSGLELHPVVCRGSIVCRRTKHKNNIIQLTEITIVFDCAHVHSLFDGAQRAALPR